jgi:hypothetical protein
VDTVFRRAGARRNAHARPTTGSDQRATLATGHETNREGAKAQTVVNMQREYGQREADDEEYDKYRSHDGRHGGACGLLTERRRGVGL